MRCSAVFDVAIKWLTQAAPGPLLGLLRPWTLTAMIAGVISFYASARSLQVGDGVDVIALTSVAANLAAILGGIAVFHEPIGSGPLEIGARFLAFCLVVAGAALNAGPDARRAYIRSSRRRLWISAWLRIASSSSSRATTTILFHAPGWTTRSL